MTRTDALCLRPRINSLGGSVGGGVICCVRARRRCVGLLSDRRRQRHSRHSCRGPTSPRLVHLVLRRGANERDRGLVGRAEPPEVRPCGSQADSVRTSREAGVIALALVECPMTHGTRRRRVDDHLWIPMEREVAAAIAVVANAARVLGHHGSASETAPTARARAAASPCETASGETASSVEGHVMEPLPSP